MERAETLATTTALDWVRPELDAALWHTRQAVTTAESAPNADLLNDAAERLRLAAGALRLLGLSGLAQVVNALAPLLNVIRDRGHEAVASHVQLVTRSIDAIAERLDGIDCGAGEQAHLMADIYLELSAAAGAKGARAVDLFHIDRHRRRASARGPKLTASADPRALATENRRVFQSGLLAFLTGKDAGLGAMHQAVAAMEQADPDPDRNLIWWVAGGLVDAFTFQALPEDREAKKLFSRIDQLLRDTGNGNAQYDERLLCELLFSLSQAQPKNRCISEIQEYWALAAYSGPATDHDLTESAAEAAPGVFASHGKVQLLDEHNRPVSDAAMLATIAREMRDSIERIEQALEGFFVSPGKTDPLALIAPNLDPLLGALTFFGMQDALELLQACRRVLGSYNDPAYLPRGGEFELIAEGIGSLAFYLEHLQQDTHATVPHLSSLMARFEELKSVPEPETQPEPVAAIAPETEPEQSDEDLGGPDPELLEIFIEEARDVLAHISTLRQQPLCLETLHDIRRGFHTLKGGGRMIGLTDFGEAAYLVEATLNAWLQQDDAPSMALGEFIDAAHAGHEAWIEQQARDGVMRVDCTSLASMAAALTEPRATRQPEMARTVLAAQPMEVFDTGVDVAEFVEPSAAKECAAPEQVLLSILEAAVTVEPDPTSLGLPVAEDIPVVPAPNDSSDPGETTWNNTVSGHTSTRQLLVIYRQEAEHHLNGLRSGLDAWRMESSQPSEAFMRAAHTLASISRTTGNWPVADVAGAVEFVVNELLEFPRQAPADLIGEVAAAIAELERMAHCLVEGKPIAATDCAARLMAAGQSLVRERQVQDAPRSAVDALAKADPAITSTDLIAITSPALTVTSFAEPTGATPTAAAAGQDERRRINDDLDTGMLPLFLEEAEDLVPQLLDSLRRWTARHWDSDAIREMQRILHTLKGSARMAGCLRLGELVHSMETDLGEALKSGQFTREALSDLEARIDRIVDSIERLRTGDGVDEADTTTSSKSLKVVRSMVTEERSLPVDEWNRAQVPRTVFRLDGKSLDELIGLAGEIGLGRVLLEKESVDFRRAVGEMHIDLHRMRQLLRDIEIHAESQLRTRIRQAEDEGQVFDPLELDRFTRFQELTRMMAESVNDIESRQQSLQQGLGSNEFAMLGMVRANDELQRRLLRVRLVRFQSITNRLYRVVRLAGKELGKPVHLEVRGGDVELDRGVLDRIAAPLEHLLRNSVVHGIEETAARLREHKREVGQISIDLKHQDNDIVITLTDDGAGLDLEAIEARARVLGLVPGQAEVAPEELANLIFQAGFSTARQIDENAGRGVGLDVVRSEISSLGGRVAIESARGEGTRVMIHVPISSRVSDVLLVRAGAHELAIPVAVIQQVLQRAAEAMTAIRGKAEVTWQAEPYPYRHLTTLLDPQAETADGKRAVPLVLLRSGGQRLAVEVDEIIGTRRIVVKQLGRQLATIGGLLGATVLASGDIVLVIDPVQMRDAREQFEPAATLARQSAPAAAPHAPSHTAMVVDDSVTVRKVVERVLSREGYRVVLARDGIDALERLRDAVPDIMLVDIEMPRMDGYDLVKTIRSDPATRSIPIIMISSRAADKHRNHALSLGVDVYLGKPFQEEVLFEHMRTLLAARLPALAAETA